MSKKHGHARCGKKPASRTYNIWQAIKYRCYNPKHKWFHRYGGRGITLWEPWHEFSQFLADVGEVPEGKSVDRIDNNGNYEPGNIKFSTQQEQTNNKSNNRLVEFEGRVQTVSQWAREKGINKITLRDRLNRGWSIADALSKKPKRNEVIGVDWVKRDAKWRARIRMNRKEFNLGFFDDYAEACAVRQWAVNVRNAIPQYK